MKCGECRRPLGVLYVTVESGPLCVACHHSSVLHLEAVRAVMSGAKAPAKPPAKPKASRGKLLRFERP